ncbi:MAG: porin [Methylococcales bacterium]|nr:porin [Methylococcales bacterium]
MNDQKKSSTSRLLATALGLTLAQPFIAYGDDEGAIESLTGFNINHSSLLQDLGITAGGWVSVGIAGNPDDPRDNFNGPVTFNDRANEFNMHQLYGFIERATHPETKNWDIGFRADLLYGTDARFSAQANFDDTLVDSDFYQLVFPQAYAEIFAPIGNGLTTKIGHFYTIIGYEVVTAPDNFFFSHAYTMQYGEPFTHTGILSSYPLNDNFTATLGVVSGWDSFFQQPPNFLGGISYTTDDENTSVAFSLITGDTQGANERDEFHRSMYSIVVSHNITDRLHYTLQHDLGVQEVSQDADAAKWYGINQYLTYDIDDHLATGVRFEWFRDEDGTRIGPIGRNNSLPSGIANHYLAATIGLNYQPTTWLTFRPEIRYDWTTDGDAFDDGRDDDQLLISADMSIRF